MLGGLAWLVVTDRPRRGAVRPAHGAIAGALVGLFAHPLMWGMLALVIGEEAGSPIGMRVGGMLGSAVFFGLFSALAYGPLTMSPGAVVGWALGRAGV